MRRWLIALTILVAVAAYFLLRPRPEPTSGGTQDPEHPVRAAALGPTPVEGAPCQVEGLIFDGVAERVRVHSQRARIDFDARLLRGGRAYSADVPEQGDLHLVAVAADGRTVALRAVCSGDGHLQLDLHFPPKDPLAATLSGRCIYLETGAPVAEATVRGSLAGAHGRIGALSWSGLTDDDGRFRLSVPPGAFAVQCGKDGDDGDPVHVHLAPRGEESVEVFVEARAAIAGIVVSAEGPVGGVSVSARNPRERERERSITDEEGRFVIRNLRPGAVVVEAHHEGAFAEAHAAAKVELPYTEVRLELSEGTLGIQGVVTGEEGPLAGAAVEAVATGPGSDRAPIRRGTITNEAGRFSLGGLTGGAYVLTGSADGYTPANVEVNVQTGVVSLALALSRACTTRVRVLPAEPPQAVMVSVQPKEGEAVEVAGETGQALDSTGGAGEGVVTARTVGSSVRTATVSAQLCGPEIVVSLPGDQGTGAIEVSVVDRDNQPVADVHVWLERAEGGQTGADGKVRFEGLSAGEYWIGARGVEPVRVKVQADLTAQAELVVGREQGKITGTVVAGQAPVEGARVIASCSDSGWDRGLEGAQVVARSGPDGAFSFDPKNGGVCTVRAEHDRMGRSALVTLRANGPPAEISLLASGSISGRVTEQESGRPVVRYTVTARSIGRASDLEARTIYVSDPSGHYQIDDVIPGQVSVSVTADQGLAHREVELAANEQKSGVDLTVFTQGALQGRVLSERSEPVARANVMVRALGRARGRMYTGTDGRFSLKVPAGEPLRVFVRAEGYYPWGSLPFDLSSEGPTDLGDIVLKSRGGDEEKEGGLGIMFAGDERGIRVIRFTDDSPAREAGMEIGDLITAIDGAPAGREPLVNWVVNLRGPAGTPVVLEVERGTMSPFTITVVRRSIGLDPVP